MLKAWLHGKHRRVVFEEDEADLEGQAPERAFALEDLLTSAVFSRLSYLDPAEVWSLLQATCEGTDRTLVQEPLPVHDPEWSFWPGLSPGAGGSHRRRVEPDVVIAWGDLVLVFEAKHQGAQDAAQWIEEVRAAHSRYGGKRVLLVAVGGVDPAMFREHVDQARRALGDLDVQYYLLRWEALREAADRRRREAKPGTAAILHDLVAALDAWGYRSRVEFASLPEAVALNAIKTSPADLAAWTVVAAEPLNRRSHAGFGSLSKTIAPYTIQTDPAALESWSLK